MYCTYILKSFKNNRYYVGSTEDINKRLLEHNLGKVRSTKLHCPWEIYHCEEYQTRSEAFNREMQIKSWKKRNMIEKLKFNSDTTLPILSPTKSELQNRGSSSRFSISSESRTGRPPRQQALRFIEPQHILYPSSLKFKFD